VVVLKGASTLVAGADGTTFLVPTGNPGMATGGTGDVLTGVIGALLCQGLAPCDAASIGAYLHGAAGDLVAHRLGQRGLIASDVVEALPEVVCGRRAAGDPG
jgi:NAD(P)H-hydrate epimerase